VHSLDPEVNLLDVTTPVKRRAVLLAGVAALCAAGGTPLLLKRARATDDALWVAGPPPTPSPAPSLTPTADTMLALDISSLNPDTLVKVETKAWYSWALLDRTTGAILGPANMNAPNRACSMIKTWIAADYLSQVKNPSKARQADIETMIRDSDSEAASDIMDELGRLKSFTRLKAACATTDFTPINSWDMATISARDTCRMADTIADAKVCSPEWTQWLLGLMRTVRRGTWGVRPAFPAADQAEIAIKNGWDFTGSVATYYANSLAVHDKWAMAVLTRYPTKVSANEELGAGVAEAVARQLLQSSELRTLFA
jgi:hypothetical protein